MQTQGLNLNHRSSWRHAVIQLDFSYAFYLLWPLPFLRVFKEKRSLSPLNAQKSKPPPLPYIKLLRQLTPLCFLKHLGDLQWQLGSNINSLKQTASKVLKIKDTCKLVDSLYKSDLWHYFMIFFLLCWNLWIERIF